jgi:hypothetical protein
MRYHWANTMSGESDKSFRVLEESERRILGTLLGHHPFDGRDELLKQLDSVTARPIEEYDDNYGSVELHVAEPTPADVKYRVPVEAEYLDDDGVPVWVLLHVRNGVMCELEICRADGRPLVSPTSAERLEPFSVNYEAGIRIVKKPGPRG